MKPLRESETAGVTTTWPEEQRQLVISPWRITEKADWANLVGYPTVTISGIDPASGDVAGGTNVTATGTGFSAFNAGAGDTFTVGGNAVSNLTVVSDTEITFDTPASDGGATGSVDVVVTIGSESATLVGAFKYYVGVSFRSASGLDIQVSTTSTVTIPADVEAGDFLVLHVMHRDTLTTPAGWTVLDGPTTPVGTNQQQTAFYRVAQSGDESTDVTVTQGSSVRILTHIQAFSSIGTITVAQSATDQSTSSGLNLPEITATADGQMAVVAMSNRFAQSGGSDTTLTAPTGYTATTPLAEEQLRLTAAYKALDEGETVSGRFEFQDTTIDTDRTAVSIILEAS